MLMILMRLLMYLAGSGRFNGSSWFVFVRLLLGGLGGDRQDSMIHPRRHTGHGDPWNTDASARFRVLGGGKFM